MAVERTYVGETAYFPDLGKWVEPGDTVEFDEAPVDDPRFLTEAQAKKSAGDIRKAKANAEPIPVPDVPAENEESS